MGEVWGTSCFPRCVSCQRARKVGVLQKSMRWHQVPCYCWPWQCGVTTYIMAAPAFVCVCVCLSHISQIFKYLFVREGWVVVHRPALMSLSRLLQNQKDTAVKRLVLYPALTPAAGVKGRMITR